jgi:hypothetical protein
MATICGLICENQYGPRISYPLGIHGRLKKEKLFEVD